MCSLTSRLPWPCSRGTIHHRRVNEWKRHERHITTDVDAGVPGLVVGIVKVILVVALCFGVAACTTDRPSLPEWETDNPIRPLAAPPLGMELYFKEAKDPPVPARVRLGRWLFFDTRLSADNTISCASCHRPEFGFAEQSPVSTGIRGQKGSRKALSIVNLAVKPQLMAPAADAATHFFWDGRATSLEDQTLGPIENPIEMASSHTAMVQTLSQIGGYKPYFKEAFGTEEITKERVSKAIADYERTRMSGNSPYDRWRFARESGAVSAAAKLGHDLFFDKARCAQCHVGSNFTDGDFHNLGVGWDARTMTFKDEGRFAITKDPGDRGAFKTPGLRDVNRRPPYMHDGSIATLRHVVDFYNRGGIKNPTQTPRIFPIGLSDAEVNALVEFLRTLDGEGYQDTAPKVFPE
jgi:cytochrome c peroxidase